MPIPTPPPDNSGGYFITSWTNGTDTHRQRMHVRPFGSDGTFTAPTASSNLTVMAEWSAFYAILKGGYGTTWTATLTSIFKNNMDGTFTEIFGWASPAAIVGTGSGAASTSDAERATEMILNFRDGFGGRARLILIGQLNGNTAAGAPIIVGGGSTDWRTQIVNYLSTATLSNCVSHGGHVLQSPARVTFCINRRLRRHYGYS